MSKLYSYLEIANSLKMDKGNLWRLIKKLGIESCYFRSQESNNHMVKGITKQDFDKIKEYREKGLPKGKIVSSNVFYLIKINSNRVKMGFTIDIEQRLISFRTICPDLSLIKTWRCERDLEIAMIKMATTTLGCKKVSEEVFEITEINLLVERLDYLFSLT